MTVARPMLVGLLVLALVTALHRVLMAMERRGWIYYRAQRRPSAGAMLGVFDEVFHPSAQVTVVEQQTAERRGPRRPAPGDPPNLIGEKTPTAPPASGPT